MKKSVVQWKTDNNGVLEELRRMAICANAGGLHLAISAGENPLSPSVVIHTVEVKMPSIS